MIPNAFSEDDARLLTILASQAGLAIENAHLFDSQRRARMAAEMQRQRLQVLTDRLVSSQEDERMRISRELHDEAGQALTSLKISLDLARARLPEEQAAMRQTLSDLGALAGETMDALRILAHDLRPPGLDAFGLNVALEGLCHDFAKRTGLSVAYEGVEMPGLRTAVALSIYRLVQEALTNIAKHAAARSVAVTLFSSGDALHLSIIDDGKGFAFNPNDPRSNGIGLVSIQERTDLLGGTLEIDTAPGRGTRLAAHIPIESDPAPTDPSERSA
jgi:signal transduction histidine kinase